MWAHILRDQLDVDAATFSACVRGEAFPGRGNAKPLLKPCPQKWHTYCGNECG